MSERSGGHDEVTPSDQDGHAERASADDYMLDSHPHTGNTYLWTPIADKHVPREWGGWQDGGVSPDQDHVYTADEARGLNWDRWAIVGSTRGTLVSLDFDLTEMNPEVREQTDLDVAPGLPGYLSRTRSRGFHLLLEVIDVDEPHQLKVETIDGVDVKGDIGRGISVEPPTPGYDIVYDDPPKLVTLSELRGLPWVKRVTFRNQSPGEGFDPEDYEPTISRADLADIETTSDFQVLQDAIAHTTYGDFALRSPQTEGGTSHSARKSFDPTWQDSESGTRLGHDGECDFIYRDTDASLDALQIVAHEEGILPPGAEGEYPQGDDFWTAVQALRERGAYIPVYEPDLETYATSPNIRRKARRILGPGVDRIRREFQDETQRAIDDAISGLVAAPTAIGKTEFAIETAGDRPVTLLTSTAKKYAEIIRRAQEKGLSVEQLPSFPRHSSLMNGSWAETAADFYYNRRLKPRTIYRLAPDDAIANDDEYLAKLDTDYSRVDLLVGHATHAFIPSAIEDRVVFFDDVDPYTAFTDVFTTEDVRAEIQELLGTIGSQYDSVEDVIANGEFVRLKREILNWLSPTSTMDELLEQRLEDEVDLTKVVRRTSGITATILDKLRLLCDGGGRYDTEEYLTACTRGGRWQDTWWLTSTPSLANARQVLVMGAYPPVDEVEQFLDDAGTEVEDVFGTSRYADWYRAKNVVVAQLSDWQHSYAGSTQKVERTEVLAEALDPDVVFGHKKLIDQVDVEMQTNNHAALPGLNEYGNLSSALIAGTAHYGDEYVAIRAQYCGDDPDVRRDGNGPSEWTTEVANRIHERMLGHPVHEAATRVGRFNSDPTIVYADTRCIPDWFDVVDATDCVQRVTKGEREVLDALGDGPATVRDMTEAADVTRQTLYNAINSLLDHGLAQVVDRGPYAAAVWDASAQPVKFGYMVLSKPEFYRSVTDPGTDPAWLAKGDTEVTTEVRTAPATVQLTLADTLDPGG